MIPAGNVIPSTDCENRLAQRYEALGLRLERLYPGAGTIVLGRLSGILRRAHAERSRDLRSLDQLRLNDPHGFLRSDRIGYSCYVDRFAGRLSDVAARLPHLRRMGVTYLHLLPILKMRNGADDGGFAVSDYGAVDPRFGDMDDLASLASRLRREGVSLCIDFTLNHTADDHAWAQAARAGDASKQAYYHILSSAEEVAAHEAHLLQVFPETAPGNFTRVEEVDGWVWTTFYPFQWDLNYANPDVLCEMAAALLRLANAGIEVFRIDSAPFLWKRRGTDCRNLPEAHLILQVLRLATEIAAPAVLLKSEAVVETHEAAAYLGHPEHGEPEAHLAYNNSLMVHLWAGLAEASGDPIRDLFRACPPAPSGSGWINYVRCHDDIGWSVLTDADGRKDQARTLALSEFYAGAVAGSFASGMAFQAGAPGAAPATCGMLASLSGLLPDPQDSLARDLAIRRIRLLHGLISALPGMPVIYMGDEIGLLNDPDYRTRDRFFEDARGLHRPAMDWPLTERTGDATQPAGRIHADLLEILSARRLSPCLDSDAACRVLPVRDARAFAALRDAGSRRLLILANFSAEPLTVSVSGSGLRTTASDRLDRERRIRPDDRVELGPYALHWFEETG